MAHILVVDEDDIAAEITAGILASAGYACGFATTANEGWRMFQWRRPDLLLLDEAMPGDNGATFLHRLRGSPGFHDLPVLLLTAAPGGIGKPLQPALLLNRVAHQLAVRTAQLATFQLRQGKGGSPRRVFL